MTKGDRINYQGKLGFVAEARLVTPGMIDLRMDGESFIRRAPVGSVFPAKSPLAKTNPSAPPRRARRNASEDEDSATLRKTKAARKQRVREASEFEEWYTQTASQRAPLTKKEESALQTLAEEKWPDAAVRQEQLSRYQQGGVPGGARALLWELLQQKRPAASRAAVAVPKTSTPQSAKRKAEEKRLALDAKRAERAWELKEQKASAARAAGVSARQYVSGIETISDIQSKLREGAALYTQEDPPRVSSDGSTYCGNPIDGTAYYLIVSDQRRYNPEWIKWSSVEAAAVKAGKTWKLTEVRSYKVRPLGTRGRHEPLINTLLQEAYQLSPSDITTLEASLEQRKGLRLEILGQLAQSEKTLAGEAPTPLPVMVSKMFARDSKLLEDQLGRAPSLPEMFDLRLAQHRDALSKLPPASLARKAAEAGVDIEDLGKAKNWPAKVRSTLVTRLVEMSKPEIQARTREVFQRAQREVQRRLAEKEIRALREGKGDFPGLVAIDQEIASLTAKLSPAKNIAKRISEGKVRVYGVTDGPGGHLVLQDARGPGIVVSAHTLVPHGATVEVEELTRKSAKFDVFFDQVYRPLLDSRHGQQVTPEIRGAYAKLAFQRKSYDPKSGKRRVARTTTLPVPEPDPSVDYFQTDEAGNRTFFRLDRSGTSPSRAKLHQYFQAFSPRRYTYVAAPTSLVRAVVAVSHGTISPEVARLFIESGGVTVQKLEALTKKKALTGCGKAVGWPRTLTNPQEKIGSCVRITVGLPAKKE
ncbi:MAG: hypothetical protein Q8R92_05330, partial [Deltaproteobacteria bacterium]|nr:hypothetical protein [Deltaproteobacteria bacterium]